MPMLIPVIVGIVASVAAEVAIGAIVIMGVSISAATVGAIVGMVVSIAASMLVNALTAPDKPKPLEAKQADRTASYRASVGPRTVVYGQALVSGPLCYIGASGTDSEYLHVVVPLADHVIAGVDAVWINDQRIPAADWDSTGAVTAGELAGLVRVRVYDGTQTTADADLVSETTTLWPSTGVGYGVAYIYIRLLADRDKFSSGLQNVSAEIRGKADIVDPRDSSVGYSNNWALCVLDYLTAEFGMRCAADELDDAYFIAAANISDEDVATVADGSVTQKRYTCDGSIGLDEKRLDVLSRLLTAGGGTLTYVQGRYRLHAGAYEAPSDTLTTDDVDDGTVQLITATAGAEVFNAIQGTYIEPAANWQAMPFPAVWSDTYDTEDGERIWQSIEFRFTTDPTRAQRLARLMLKTSRDQRQLKLPVRYGALRFSVHQTLAVTIPEFGLDEAPFMVIGWSFDPIAKKVQLVLQETSAAGYAWDYDAAEAVLDPPTAPVASPLSIAAPGSLVITASTGLQSDGSVAPALLVTWTSAAHPFIRAHEVQWRLSSGPGAWNSMEVPAPTLRAVLAPVLVGVGYDVRVRAVTGLARGAWTSTASATGAADTTAPSAPTSFAVLGVLRGFALRWTKATAPDLDVTEVWENTVGTWYKIGETRADTYLRQGFTAGDTASYRLRSRDQSGNLSGYTSVVGPTTVPAAITSDITAGAVTRTDSASWSGSYGSSSYAPACSITVGEVGVTADLIVHFGITGGYWNRWMQDLENWCELRLDGTGIAESVTMESSKTNTVKLTISGVHTLVLYIAAINNGNWSYWGLASGSSPLITGAVLTATFLKR